MNNRSTAVQIGACVLAVLAALWSSLLPHGILMGDDLRMVYGVQHGGYASTPLDGFIHASLGTYRPVLALIFSLIVPIFGNNFALYQDLTTAIEIGCAIVIFNLAFRLSRDNMVVALGAGVAFILSRFAYYSIGQTFGLMEGPALLFTLLIVSDVLSAYDRSDRRPLLRATLWFGLMLFTDERYVAVLPFLLLAIWLFPETPEAERPSKIALLAIPTGLFILNVVSKLLVFHTHFLQASGAPIRLDLGLILSFVWAGVLNILGYYVGPAYLSAQDISDAGTAGYLLALLLAGPFIVALVALGREYARGKLHRPEKTFALLWAALFLPLLLTACVSFRQEFRWLYGPYAVALLGLTAAAGYFQSHRPAIRAAALGFTAAAIVSAILVRPQLENIYFFYAEHVAEQVDQIAAEHGNDALVVVDHKDPTVSQWILMQDEFVQEYHLAGGRIYYVNAVDDIPKLGFSPAAAPISIADVSGTSAKEIQPQALTAIARAAGETKVVSFTAAYDHGVINSLVPASTPTGRGVFINAWPSDAGNVTSLTVLATYRYAYPGIRIGPNEALKFRAAAPYAMGSGVHVFVEVNAGRTITRVYDEGLPAASATGPNWDDHEIPLNAFRGRTVTIVFGADVRDNDPTAAWAAFGDPVLVRRTSR